MNFLASSISSLSVSGDQTTPTLAQEASQLLDFSKPFNVTLLESVMDSMYNGHGPEQSVAQEVLTALQAHQDAWTIVDSVLTSSQKTEAKYFALQILDKLIQTRWKSLPREQCNGIKKFIVNVVIDLARTQESLQSERIYLAKLNMTLVLICKKEWPQKWDNFIPDIVGASKSSESMCENNMKILKLLSEEVFDFSAGQLNQTKAKHLKNTMCSQFKDIFGLCLSVLETSENASLVSATLDTLLKFLNWIPLGYVFETNLVLILINKFIPLPLFRNVTLSCLTEVATCNQEKYHKQSTEFFMKVVTELNKIIPEDVDIRNAYNAGSDCDKDFIQNLAIFFSTYLKLHAPFLDEYTERLPAIQRSLEYLVAITTVDDKQVFQICLEYWCHTTDLLYMEDTFGSDAKMCVLGKDFYAPYFSQLREILIGRMAKPQEVFVVEDDQGEVVREVMTDTDASYMYKCMRETLVYLTHLDYDDTERILLLKLSKQVSGEEWSWKNLNTLCWAMGSISGAASEENEKTLMISMIKELLNFCEHKKGRGNKAIIASNIMYIVGQYPRFLKVHWPFLKTVVTKLFEFMHESHEGVKDMACDTFIKISKKCKRQFVISHNSQGPYIEDILDNLNVTLSDLDTQQVFIFYEAVGYMIGAARERQYQEELMAKYMRMPNDTWDAIISQATADIETLRTAENVKKLSIILKTNEHACRSLGVAFYVQMTKIYKNMLDVYKVMSESISTAITCNGDLVTKQPLIKGMQGVKRNILKLIATWMSSVTYGHRTTADDMMPPFIDVILKDYQCNTEHLASEPQVLSTMASIVNGFRHKCLDFVPQMISGACESTLKLIGSNLEDYPEHRINFFLFLEEVNKWCFSTVVKIGEQPFRLLVEAVMWGVKHTMRDVADTSLNVLLSILQNIFVYEADNSTDNAGNVFARTYFLFILQHIFTLLPDASHTAGLPLHSTVLAYMYSLVANGKIRVPLDPSNAEETLANVKENVDFLTRFTTDFLNAAHPHLTSYQLKVTVQGLFDLSHDDFLLRGHLRDFVIQIREFNGDDDSDLYLQEREQTLKSIQERRTRVKMRVPGIFNPYEILELA